MWQIPNQGDIILSYPSDRQEALGTGKESPIIHKYLQERGSLQLKKLNYFPSLMQQKDNGMTSEEQIDHGWKLRSSLLHWKQDCKELKP